jgi:CheY-like chemotaxis protein
MSHILIADDDAVQLDLRKGFLQSAGHEVSVAITVAQAIERLRTRAADLIIIDLRFPDSEGRYDAGEGLALIRGIRGLGCAAPILVLSGWPEDLDESPEAAFVSRVMLKPVKPSALMEAVREMIV